MKRSILVFNAGSSTLKYALYTAQSQNFSFDTLPDLTGLLEKKNLNYQLKIKEGSREITHRIKAKNLSLAMAQIANFLPNLKLEAVGHRVVHGGTIFNSPTLIDSRVIRQIKKLSYLAPLHNPANLEGIQIGQKLFPNVPQVAVFDTSFHRQMPETNIVYPGPYEWFKKGIRRFGFHGISHKYAMERVQNLLKRDIRDLNLITCHLGNGCSLAAVRGGHSLDTTMGFTPMEGLMMGTRSGSIDPGILFFLMKERKRSANELEEILNKKSGLKGICATNDMREVLRKIKKNDQKAVLAFNLFIHSLVKNIAMMVASLGGIDLIVFTGGIGENSVEVRQKAGEALKFLGLEIDAKINDRIKNDGLISSKNSRVKAFVVYAKEDWLIAEETLNLLQRIK